MYEDFQCIVFFVYLCRNNILRNNIVRTDISER